MARGTARNFSDIRDGRAGRQPPLKKLVTAARDGLPFDHKTGLPPTLQSQTTWYEHASRENALAAEGAESALARRHYDLRHACVSRWPIAGVPVTQVAEWAGVLMRPREVHPRAG